MFGLPPLPNALGTNPCPGLTLPENPDVLFWSGSAPKFRRIDVGDETFSRSLARSPVVSQFDSGAPALPRRPIRPITSQLRLQGFAVQLHEDRVGGIVLNTFEAMTDGV